MEKAEAAEFLGVSGRTIDRLVASGRLTKGRKMGKTRPVATFEEGQLETLKQNLKLGKPEPATDARTLPTVGFRLDPAYFERLKAQASEEGISPGEYARHLVVRSLETGGEEISRNLSDLRQGLGEMLFVLMVSRLDMTEEEAHELLRETALRRGRDA